MGTDLGEPEAEVKAQGPARVQCGQNGQFQRWASQGVVGEDRESEFFLKALRSTGSIK